MQVERAAMPARLLRAVGVVAPEQVELVEQADLRPADQLPGPRDPDEEADDDDDGDRASGTDVHAGIDRADAGDELDHERAALAGEEERFAGAAAMLAAQPDE